MTFLMRTTLRMSLLQTRTTDYFHQVNLSKMLQVNSIKVKIFLIDQNSNLLMEAFAPAIAESTPTWIQPKAAWLALMKVFRVSKSKRRKVSCRLIISTPKTTWSKSKRYSRPLVENMNQHIELWSLVGSWFGCYWHENQRQNSHFFTSTTWDGLQSGKQFVLTKNRIPTRSYPSQNEQQHFMF